MNPQDELNKAVFSELVKKSLASDNLWLKGIGVVVSVVVISFTVVKTGILNSIPMEALHVFTIAVVLLASVVIHTLYKMSVEKQKKLVELYAELEELTRLTWYYGVEWSRDDVPHCPKCKKPLGPVSELPCQQSPHSRFLLFVLPWLLRALRFNWNDQVLGSGQTASISRYQQHPSHFVIKATIEKLIGKARIEVMTS